MSLANLLNPTIFGNLSPEAAVIHFRELLFCEAQYVGLRPDAVTISANLFVPDGGIDAQVEADCVLPEDTLLRPGRNGFQLKTGTSFKPWQKHSLEKELLSRSGELVSEVKQTLEVGGHYVLVCFGLDFTPKQRNNSKTMIAGLFSKHGFPAHDARIDILGQAQLKPYFDRYPSLLLSLMGGSDEDFLSVPEWSKHEHMSKALIPSEEQSKQISLLRERLKNGAKHLRVLGETGLGKTRLVLEAVRAEDIASNTIYVEHGERFSQTKLFRELLRDGLKYPLVLVLDELSERGLSDIWGHLKPRCGALKLITIYHSPDSSRDNDIERIIAPKLPDGAIRKILASHVGDKNELDRWVSICEGSPRVAQAVGENLAANPGDIFKSPATVPIWERFLCGYARHDSEEARQFTCVMRHIALFSRFGFEEPVADEAKYISALVAQTNPMITWGRFQEIVQTLRERRILQGAHTLFIVPWALHIYLWREFWFWHGRGFDFPGTFESMPKTLHGWFMNMFCYAHDSDASKVVEHILEPNGIFSDRSFLCSAKGTSFLSTLAEADSTTVMNLIERTFGTWSQEELLAFSNNRQGIISTLEKIAVWRPTVLRAIRMLSRLALAENSNYSNNATGTLLALFRIGPEWAATEASPTERLLALSEMLQSSDNALKKLGLNVAESALQTSSGLRRVGPEYQGLKERANIWKPETYGEYWDECKQYWECLVSETRNWEDSLRKDANFTIIEAAKGQLGISELADSVLSVIEQISVDPATDMSILNKFFISRYRWHRESDEQNVRSRLRRLERLLTRKSLESRFQRYVLDTTWEEWDDDEVEPNLREKTRPKKIVRALAKRVVHSDDNFKCLLPRLMTNHTETAALFLFGEALCEADRDGCLLEPMLSFQGESIQFQCLGGYLNVLKKCDPERWKKILVHLLKDVDMADKGADLVWHSCFNDEILDAWLDAFEHKRIDASYFRCLCYGMSWKRIPDKKMIRLLNLLAAHGGQVSASLLVHLLDQVMKADVCPVDTNFIFKAVTLPLHFGDECDTMHLYHWKSVCERLVLHDTGKAMFLLDFLFEKMGSSYRLSYDHKIRPLAIQLCKINPKGAWRVITPHLLSESSISRGAIYLWLQGGIGEFDGKIPYGPIKIFPVPTVLDWIEEDPANRASIIAQCVSPSLDDVNGGALTRALLSDYGDLRSIVSAISCSFHSGGASGPWSQHLRKKRDRLRTWLAKGFDSKIISWIEDEILSLDRQIEDSEISEERENWRRSIP